MEQFVSGLSRLGLWKRNMKVIIYGIGHNFIRNYKWLADHFEICGLVDGSPKKQGEKIGRFIIEDFTGIQRLDFEKILVTPNAHYEITQLLLQNGISKERICYLHELQNSDSVGNTLKIAFRIVGGMGDGLIGLNYIWYFHKRFIQGHIRLYLEFAPQRDALRCFLEETGLADGITVCEEEEVVSEKYHLYIRLQRYPEAIYADKNTISRLAPSLIDYVFLCEKFKIFNPRFFIPEYAADGESALLETLNGRTRIMQPDIYNFLGVDEEYKFPIHVSEAVLEKFDLQRGEYITVQRGCESRYYTTSSTKLWSVGYYNELFLLLEREYPDVTIVFIGAEYEWEHNISFHGKNLVGKTSLLEFASILKFARIHISTEGGSVHLRHALHGGSSIVLFGPTSEHFFGYSENRNLRSKACPYPCEWVTKDWHKNCMRGKGKAECMETILPGQVFEEVRALLE